MRYLVILLIAATVGCHTPIVAPVDELRVCADSEAYGMPRCTPLVIVTGKDSII